MAAALCQGRPAPGEECGGAGGARPNAFTELLSVLRTRSAAIVSAGVSSGGGGVQQRVLGRREASAVRTADRYISARLSGRNEEVLRLVAEDVRLTSSRDGVVHGKKGFADYLERVKASGRWDAARWDASRKRAEVRGLVKVVFVNVNVVAHFGFDRRGRINDIFVGTKR